MHVAVDRQVDPAEAAVSDAPLHFVLPSEQVTARKLGNKRVPRAALGAEALGTSRLSVVPTPDGLVAVGVAAEPPPLRHLRIGQDRGGGIAHGNARHGDNSGAEPAAGAAGFR